MIQPTERQRRGYERTSKAARNAEIVRLSAAGVPSVEIAARYGVSPQRISQILKREEAR